MTLARKGNPLPKPSENFYPQQQRARSPGSHSTVHHVPPEILGIIFGFVLGREPFRGWQRKAYVCLRSVSSSWRRAAATPGLCTGLDISLDAWAEQWEAQGISSAEEGLAPWLAIISPTHPYHLMMTSLGRSSEEVCDGFIRHILTTTPSPTNLSILGTDVLPKILASTDSSYDRVNRLRVEHFGRTGVNLARLDSVFPNLQTFVLHAAYDPNTMFKHSNLQCLVLDNLIMGLADEFINILSSLPSLRELDIGTNGCGRPDIANAPLNIINLPSIEILAISGENLALEILCLLTLPSLKFFGLTVFGLGLPDRSADLHASLDFFSRSRLANSTISVVGIITTTAFFASLVESLPPGSLLHVHIESLHERDDATAFKPGPVKQVFSSDLEWLEAWSELKRCDEPVKICIPVQSNAAGEEHQLRREELGELGYNVVTCSTRMMEEKLKSRVPWMSIDWDWWGF
ncbi:hypothetical protein BKA70DRAFT_1568661 [Coprinopsis sp. MPI-PUGE-AT-0042]|nr:hypothetical protein BKA70DRAFT_1568661 [Coprinopsis sp. MPI-PUGE-AT-0042]